MAASDYITNPQITGAGPPNLADALYKMIRGIPQAYQEGAEGSFKRGQMARVEDLQKPLDVDLNTQEGINAGIREMIRRGGGEYFEKMVPYLTGVQADRSLAEGPPEGRSAPATDHQTPEKLKGEQPPSAASVGDASQADQADDTAGPYTLKALVNRSGLTNDPVRTANMIGAKLGINPNTLLTREQAGQVSAALENKFGEGGAGTDVREAPDFTGKATNVTPIVPNRVKTVQAPPYQTITPPQAPPAAQTPVGTEAQAIQYENRAAARSKWLQAHARNASPGAVKEAEAAIADDRARAKDIRDKLADAAKQERQQQLDIGKSDAEKFREAQQKRAADREVAVNKANETALEGKSRIGMQRSLTNQPGFNSGVYSHFIDTLNGIGARLFNQPNLGTSGQFFDKLRAGSVLNEIRNLGGSGAGPVRVAEMKFVDTMQASREMQPGSIRSALETENRLHERAQDIFQLKREYLKTHRELDDGFLDQVNNLWERKPLFSKAEMAHPDLLAMPIFESEAQMRASRMPGGTRFRTGPGPDATIKTVPAGNERGETPNQRRPVRPEDRT